jgi:hypothetical protein
MIYHLGNSHTPLPSLGSASGRLLPSSGHGCADPEGFTIQAREFVGSVPRRQVHWAKEKVKPRILMSEASLCTRAPNMSGPVRVYGLHEFVF